MHVCKSHDSKFIVNAYVNMDMEVQDACMKEQNEIVLALQKCELKKMQLGQP